MADGFATPLHRPMLHESGLKHVTGEAKYVDDFPAPQGMLVVQVVGSTVARGKLRGIDSSAARGVKGVHAILTAADIPGDNNVGPVIHDEELLASAEVHFLGQAVAVVVGETYEACREAASKLKIDIEPFPAIVTIEDGIEKRSWLSDPHTMLRGDPDSALAKADVRFQGEVVTGGQDHFYLETQTALAVPGEGATVHIYSSTQHPSEVQAIVAHVMDWHRHQIVVEVPRMGGGFGGKETQAANYAAIATLAAMKTGRPVKCWLNRDQDMMWTGKRHPFLTKFDVGFSKDGTLVGLDAQLYSNGGFSNDLTRAITDRALFHSDNGYFLPNVRLVGQAVKTNLPSNTAFRGFGGPQGMAVIEDIISRFCERTGLDPVAVRTKNFYGPAPRNLTPFWQVVEDNRLPRIFDELLESSSYAERRAQIDTFNQTNTQNKRGLALTPVKFGISFTTSFLNQAGALLVMYSDGSAQLNHGGTEMGQGLHTKMLAVCAHELGLRPERIRVMNTATDKVPNTSATAASSGSDLNGQAVKQACEIVRERLRPIAAALLQAPADKVTFADGHVHAEGRSISLEKVAGDAYLKQISMSATGYYRTPDITYDKAAGRGKPFHYFAYGAAVSEVELSGLTGEWRLRRVDILHDVGNSLAPTIDKGQVEGGFIQGLGWLTTEELVFDDKGYLRTHSPDTYKIPACGDAPVDFRVELLSNAEQHNVIHGSKAVGEPPLMLALSTVAALRDAVAAFGPKGREVKLPMPCTSEALLFAVEAQRA